MRESFQCAITCLFFFGASLGLFAFPGDGFERKSKLDHAGRIIPEAELKTSPPKSLVEENKNKNLRAQQNYETLLQHGKPELTSLDPPDYQGIAIVLKAKGEVHTVSDYTEPRKVTKGVVLFKESKIFTGLQSATIFSFGDDVLIEMGSEGSFGITEVDKESKKYRFLVMSGRFTIRVKNGAVVTVRTPSATVTIPDGRVNIALSAFNSLVALREGKKKITVETPDAMKFLSPGRYCLANTKGELFLGSPKIEKRDPRKPPRPGKEEGSDLDAFMSMGDDNQDEESKRDSIIQNFVPN